MPASHAVSFLYPMPMLAFVAGSVRLGRVPTPLSLVGGAVAPVGVVLVAAEDRTLRGKADA